ncbi:MAG: Sec-independent protein translocase protein TatB [Rhodospirillaceae bacterium]|jgi:sec-independent protein translocase protein TatB
MFDIGWQEVMVIAVLAIIVIGPKDLPRAIKTITHWVRKARMMARDLQDGLDEVVREAELDEIKKEANKIMDGTAVDPTRELVDELDMSEFEKDWNKTVGDLKDSTDPNAKKADAAAKPAQAEAKAPDTKAPDAKPQVAALEDDPTLAPKLENPETGAAAPDKAKG